MSLVIVGLLIVVSFAVASLTYVYAYRGVTRYENFTEYVRKGWPIFSPLNCLLYLFSQPRAKHAIMDLSEYKELDVLKDNWETIRDEAENLYKQGYFESTKKPGSDAYYDIGFRTFYKYGWSKFYLKWYGYTHASALRFCPKTVEILKRVPSVNGAMFSLLPAGSQLTRHLDPVACSLRYHLGLSTPNSNDCYINVDGTSYSWRDGDALLFDETFLHYAKNNSDRYRLILMCDVNRPTNFFGSIINFFYKILTRMTVVPNLDGDKRGLANTIFSSLSPLIQKIKNLKQTHPRLYPWVKHSINGVLLMVLLGIVAGVFSLFGALV